MPELPEVTTTVNGLQKKLPRLVIKDVWSDLPKNKVSRKDFLDTIKSASFFKKFKKEVIGSKVVSVERRAKNILIHLSNKKTILIHLKMTGHLLFGDYVYIKKENKWVPSEKERKSLHDPFNRFLHVVFSFNNKKHLAFSDSRKFGKVTLLDTKNANQTKHLKGVGPEPLDKNFDFKKFKKSLFSVKANAHRPIKQILMDQYTIAGIGNIYSDEMLWLSKIHPKSQIKNISEKDLRILYKNMRKVLEKGIKLKGDSMSDYRNIDGERGNFQNHHNAYRKTGEKCGKKGCRGVIMREIISGRSAHFCQKHQVLY